MTSIKLRFLSLILISISSLLSTSALADAFPENYRCWADPGFEGVLKIDVHNNRMCMTGIGGQVYDCNAAESTLPIVRSLSFISGDTRVEEYVACDEMEGRCQETAVSVKIYKRPFPRPDFPNHEVFWADHFTNWSKDPYRNYSVSFPLTNEFQFGDYYCLSEQYFVSPSP